MSMQGKQEHDAIDALIDAAARSLMTGEPSSGLRARVRERIADRTPLRRFRPAWAGVALAAVVAGVIVGRTFVDLSNPAADNKPPSVAATTSAPRPSDDHLTAPPDRVGPLVIARSTASGARRLVPTDPAPENVELPIDAIKIDPLTTQQIAVEETGGVMPIEIEPLQIEPLQVRAIQLPTPDSQPPKAPEI